MGARKLLPLLLAAVVVVFTARYLFWNDARDVTRRLDAMADAASLDAEDTPVLSPSKAAELAEFVTDDVIIRTDPASFVGGRRAVVRLVADAAAIRRTMRVTLDDVQVELIDRVTATAFCTLKISGGGPAAADPAPRQVHATLVKQNGEWLLMRGEVLRILDAVSSP